MEIENKLKLQDKQIKGLKQAVEALKEANKKQAELNKKYDESLGKRYIHEAFENKSEEEIQSIMDEWLNGEDENKRGNK